MTTLDLNTPCSACPRWVRSLFEAAQAYVLLREVDGQAAEAALDLLHIAVDEARRHVSAHDTNQLHAFSPALFEARDPKVPNVTFP